MDWVLNNIGTILSIIVVVLYAGEKILTKLGKTKYAHWMDEVDDILRDYLKSKNKGSGS